MVGVRFLLWLVALFVVVCLCSCVFMYLCVCVFVYFTCGSFYCWSLYLLTTVAAAVVTVSANIVERGVTLL